MRGLTQAVLTVDEARMVILTGRGKKTEKKMEDRFTVIFDMDGVLLDTERVHIQAWKRAADDLGIQEIDSVCYQFIGINRALSRQIFNEKYAPDFDYDKVWEKVKSHADRICRGGLPMKPGAEEILRFLKGQGVPLALASSTNIDTVRKELLEDGILEYFDQVIGGDMIRRSKPDPEIFLLAAQKMNAAPESCYVIEDSYNGIRAASAAGMHPIMVPDLLPPDEEMKRLAEAILPSLQEVIRYFKPIAPVPSGRL